MISSAKNESDLSDCLKKVMGLGRGTYILDFWFSSLYNNIFFYKINRKPRRVSFPNGFYRESYLTHRKILDKNIRSKTRRGGELHLGWVFRCPSRVLLDHTFRKAVISNLLFIQTISASFFLIKGTFSTGRALAECTYIQQFQFGFLWSSWCI